MTSNPSAFTSGMYWSIFYDQKIVVTVGPGLASGAGTEQVDVGGACCIHNTRHQLLQFAHP